MSRLTRQQKEQIRNIEEIAEVCGVFFSASTIKELFPSLPYSISRTIKKKTNRRRKKKRLCQNSSQARYIRYLYRYGFALTDILMAESYYTADVLRVLADLL